jgi:hypothetical protein
MEEAPIGDRSPPAISMVTVSRSGGRRLRRARNLVLHLGAGGGRFQPGIRTPLEAKPSQIALADLDSDGKLDIGKMDLAAASPGPGTVTFLINQR